MKRKRSGFEKYLDSTIKEDPRFAQELLNALSQESVATQLRVLRHFRGLSQVMLGKKAKLLQPELARLESIRSNPRLSTLENLADKLDAKLELIPRELLSFLTMQRLRASGEKYFTRVVYGK
jgi:DNA-binding phage protein